MSDVVKNPNRDRPRPVELRKPEYERLGVNPTPFMPGNYGGALNIPKARPSSIKESEVSGASFDTVEEQGKIVPARKDAHIIDNNDFLSFGFPTGKISQLVEEGAEIDFDSDSELEVESKPLLPAVGDYILMISGDIIMSGPLGKIEEKVKGILYGEDIDFELSEVPQEDIIVLKRVDIQVGVFIKD
jgi:hypothetical protein